MLLVFSVCISQAQNTTGSKQQERVIVKIKTNAQEKINAILVEKMNVVLEFEKEKLKQRKDYEKEMYKRLDKYDRKDSLEFKEMYEYELGKLNRFVRNLERELTLMSNSFDIKIEAIELERDLNIEQSFYK